VEEVYQFKLKEEGDGEKTSDAKKDEL